MNSSIEAAFVASLTPIMAPLAVVAGLSSSEFPVDDGGLIVDGSADNESPASTLWRLSILFRLDMPTLIAAADQAPVIRAKAALLDAWLRDRQAVLEAWQSDTIALIPGWHIGTTSHRTEGERLVAEIEVTAGFHEI